MFKKKIAPLIIIFLFITSVALFYIYYQKSNSNYHSKNLTQKEDTGKHNFTLIYELNAAEDTQEDAYSKTSFSENLISKILENKKIDFSSIKTEGYRIIIELADEKDLEQTAKTVEEIPVLEFREEMTEDEKSVIRQQYSGTGLDDSYLSMLYFKNTGLDGRSLKNAEIYFDPNKCQPGMINQFLQPENDLKNMKTLPELNTCEPGVLINFNDDGKKLLSDISSRNMNRKIAIFLNGSPVSIPTVTEPITEGEAVISGEFTLQEVKGLVEKLNSGALPATINRVE